MTLVKKSFRLEGHATSVALEPEFWQQLELLAAVQNCKLPTLVAQIDETRQRRNLASALRVYVLTAIAKI